MTPRRGWPFWLAFAIATLLIAGAVSNFSSADPDGLDSATLRGCEAVQTADGEQLTGECIARRTTEHHLSASPMADYAGGGIAGVIGVLVTAAVAGSAFWLISRARR